MNIPTWILLNDRKIKKLVITVDWNTKGVDETMSGIVKKKLEREELLKEAVLEANEWERKRKLIRKKNHIWLE